MRFLAAILLLTSSLTATAQSETLDGDAPQRYRVDSAVWCSGELRGEPELLLSPGVPGTFEIDGPESSWRLSVEVETPGRAEGAAPDSLWFKVGIEQLVDGEWEFLTDTMLGTPLGTPGIVTVVGDDQADSGPESAPLYVEMTAERIDSDG